jgi:STE24 endopeptidase
MNELFWSKLSLIVLFLLSSKLIVQYYLNLRQKKYVSINRASVPQAFSKQISLAEHQKAADYTNAKVVFSNFNLGIEFILTLIWLYAGGFAYIESVAISLATSMLMQGLIFFGMLGALSMLVSLPLSYYQTFVLEEKFGFNKSTLKIFVMDLIKQLIITILIGGGFLALILYIMTTLGENWWIWAWIAMSSFQLIMMWAYPTLIAPLFNKFQPLEAGETKEKIESLLRKADFQSNGLFVMDASKRSSHGNAYFTGFGKNKRIVFFDTLLKNLLPSEIEAVLAHELGHFKKKHIHKMIFFSFLMTLISFWILGYLTKNSEFYTAFGLNQSAYGALALFTIIFPAVTFYLTPLMSTFSRKHEYEADHYAALMSSAQFLQDALVKLYKENASTLTPDPIYSRFYHSHPAAWERIQYLETLKK